MRSDDLAPLLGPGPGDPTAIRGGQGVVVEWDPLTAENVIRFRGTDLVNLPILATAAEVLLIQPGDSVFLHIVGSGATATIYVVGRITVPGTPQAATALAMFGIRTAEVLSLQSTASLIYTDLPTVGPTVADVLIGPTGRCLVTVSAKITVDGTNAGGHDAFMSYAVSGATIFPAQDGTALNLWFNDLAVGQQRAIQASRTSIETGLTPGLHTFTAKYRADGFSGDPAKFATRNIAVIPF